MLVLMIGVPLPCTDGTKYMGVSDRLRFTDTPLRNSNFRPERRHTSEKLVMVSDGGKLSARATKLSAKHKQYAELIESTARRFKLHPELLHAVIRAESNYDPKAVSPAGAVGLMQLTRATAERYKVINRRDPAENVRGGAQYLRYLLNRFSQNLQLALAGYNAGGSAVVKYGKQILPYPEILRYLWVEYAAMNR